MQRVLVVLTVCLFAPASALAQSIVNPTAAQLAAALDIPASDIVSVQTVAAPDRATQRVVTDWGKSFAPRAGRNMAALSTGVAADQKDPGYNKRPGGTRWNAAAPDAPIQPAAGCVPPQSAFDLTEVRVVLRAPLSATGFTFDYNYFSEEYPTWACSEFSDAFLALVESPGFSENVAFDALGRYATTNDAFFAVPNIAHRRLLVGTGVKDGGATLWVAAHAPVVGGELVTVRFIVFDGGDDAYDTSVLIDNFRWTR